MAIAFLKRASLHFAQEYSKILLAGFDERKNISVRFSDFIPYKQNDSDPTRLYDSPKDSPKVKRLKCLALACATPIIQAISILLSLANRIAKLITFAHFWYPRGGEAYSFKSRLFEFGRDFLRVVFSSLIYAGLELSAIYGLALPYDAAKLYATFERCAFGKAFLATCFQPSATHHLFGGDISKANQW